MSIGKAKCTSSTHLSVEMAVVWGLTVLTNAAWAQQCETENHPANLKYLAEFFPEFIKIVLVVPSFFRHVLEIYHVSQKISIVSWFLMKFPNFWKNCVLLPKQALLRLSPPSHPPLECKQLSHKIQCDELEPKQKTKQQILWLKMKNNRSCCNNK